MLPLLLAQPGGSRCSQHLVQIIASISSGTRGPCGCPSWQLQPADQAGGSSRSIVTGHTHIPRSQHDRYRTEPKNYVQLLQHIARSTDVSRLSQLVGRYQLRFDAVHVAAALSMMPKLYQPPTPGGHLNSKQMKQRKQQAARLLAELQVLASSQVPRMFARQVAAITYALSRCSPLLPGGSAANPTTQQLLHSMLTRLTKDNGRLLWQGASGPSITFLLHGLARLGYTPSSSSSSAATAARATTQQLCSIIARHQDRLHARELATSAWALARINRRRPGLLHGPSTAAALSAISEQVVQQKLYLRPSSMVGLVTAAAWFRRKDEALLTAVAEEAVAQLHDLRPPHLAVLAWAFSSLSWAPPPELTAGILAASARQLEHFSASSLGLLLQGLRQQGALDPELLAQVAAGIAKEEQVALNPRDAARILAAFVAVPKAGHVRDVEGMAERIAGAIWHSAPSARPSTLTDLMVCYSKLPYHHPLVLRLLVRAGERGGEFSMSQWVKLLQSAARLGYSRVVADPEVEGQLVLFYEAADEALKQHLGADAGEQHPQDEAPKKKWWQKLSPLKASSSRQQGGKQAQQQQAAEGSGNQQHHHQQQQVQFDDAVDVGKLLSDRGMLSEAGAVCLSDVGRTMLPRLKLRKLMLLLSAVTSKDSMLANQEGVRQLLRDAAQHLLSQDLSTATTAVLAGLTKPLAVAMSKDVILTGDVLLQSLFQELLPVLEECSQEQLMAVWGAMKRSGVVDAALEERALDIARRRGWRMPQTGLFAA